MIKGEPTNAGGKGLISGWGRSPGGDMATHSSIHAWRILRTEEPGELFQSCQDSDRTGVTYHAHTLVIFTL